MAVQINNAVCFITIISSILVMVEGEVSWPWLVYYN